MKMTIRIGSRDSGYYVVPPGSHMAVEVNGKEADLGTAEGVVELLRWYSSQPSPDSTMEIHDRLAVAEASAEGLKAALREAQARCEALVKEHAKYREGVIAGDKMVSDKRAALEKRIDELTEVIASKDKRIDNLQELVDARGAVISDLQAKIDTLHDDRRGLIRTIENLNTKMEAMPSDQDSGGEVAKLRFQASEKDRKILHLCQEVEAEKLEIEDLQGAVAAKDAMIARLSRELETTKGPVRLLSVDFGPEPGPRSDEFIAGLELERSIEERLARIERVIPWLGGVK